jgi:hypothetical protein
MSETVVEYVLTEAMQSPQVVETWFDAVLHSTDATAEQKIQLLHECAAAYWQRIQNYEANAKITAEAMRVLHRSDAQQKKDIAQQARTIRQLMAEHEQMIAVRATLGTLRVGMAATRKLQAVEEEAPQ